MLRHTFESHLHTNIYVLYKFLLICFCEYELLSDTVSHSMLYTFSNSFRYEYNYAVHECLKLKLKLKLCTNRASGCAVEFGMPRSEQ